MMVLGACAQSASEIAPTYVSSMNYEGYSCPQLQAEVQRVAARASQAMGAQNQAAENNQVMMAMSIILFWPALFALNGQNGATEVEVARLKGEMEAIEQANIQKNCCIQFQRQSAA